MALFPLFTTVGFTVTMLSGVAIDRFGAGRMAQVYMLPWIAGFALLSQAQSLGGAAVAMAVLGLGSGMQSTVPASYWAHFYGTRHIGAIKSLAVALMVLGSALGPGITGALIDLGIDFPQQMIAITLFFAFAAVLIGFGVQRATPLLRAPQAAVVAA